MNENEYLNEIKCRNDNEYRIEIKERNFIPEGQMTKWWFHLEVHLCGFLLVVEVVNFK